MDLSSYAELAVRLVNTAGLGHEGGDHLIAVGEVDHAESGPGNPLLYRYREFGTMRPTAEGEL